ncbi:galactitol-1-phosphate 5-dehydrogenase [Pelagibacterium montanilacus]|uniref:galactitol-1-phosphate 5-dehydrogenase n=1 Tax=Pelagibacterium montanilacus TaxID=2185280 RepID=UPI000F8C6CAB|nr:galactitol-1-phosphate 5-dehydrogenase [Pelagibacterium montanilacus]
MRAAVLHSPGDVRIENVEKPVIKPGHALVRVAACGVCGSDLPRVLEKGAHRMPLVVGHEFSGHITELGEGIEGFAVGELVAVPPMIPCFECDQCLTGNFSRCRDYSYFGSRRDGAYAEYVLVPKTNLLKTPQGLDPRAVAMTDPASIALHAIWKAPVTAGQRGGVVGCGPIGLFAIQWFKIMGASEVVAIDISEDKLELARQAGATHTFLADTWQEAKAYPCDTVVEAVGHPSAQNTAVQLAGPGGHAVFIGIPTTDVTWSQATYNHLLRQEISLHGAWNSFAAPFPGKQWTVALEKLGSGELKWEFMISHDLDLDELPAMFESFRTRNQPFSKVIFRA